jgi:antitoxin (DNA-binding transcriptional repressor) of toxin-antitoxin stability system
MEVPITQFRRQIFALVAKALEGGEVWVTHKGRRVKIVPEEQPARRLSRITPMEVMVDPNFDMNNPAFKAEWLVEMEKEWEKDWADL